MTWPSFLEWLGSQQSYYSAPPIDPRDDSRQINPQPAPASFQQPPIPPPYSLNPPQSQINFDAFKRNIEFRLIQCPDRTYYSCLSPTPNLIYLYYIAKIENTKYVLQWTIFKISENLFRVQFSTGTPCFYDKKGLEELIQINFSQPLEACEKRRKEEAIHILSSPIWCDLSPKDLLLRFQKRKSGTFIIVPQINASFPCFNLIFNNCSREILSKTIIVEDTGFLLVDRSTYFTFEDVLSYFELNYSLLQEEREEKRAKKIVVDEFSATKETEVSQNTTSEEPMPEKTSDITERQLETETETKLTEFALETKKPLAPKKLSPEDEIIIAKTKALYKEQTGNNAPEIILCHGQPIFCPTPIIPTRPPVDDKLENP